MPQVSVVMAVHNGEPYLHQAIDSILGQTFESFEFLIVDDGSTDRTREIVRAFGDPRTRLVINDRKLGLSRSLNRGLALARGEYLARQDADDVSETPRLARQIAFLDTHPDVGLVGSWYRKIDACGRPLGDRQLPCDHTRLSWALHFFCPFVHSAVMLRRAPVLAQVGPYNETLRYALDQELWLRIARRFPVANLGEYLVRYRMHPGSMTETYEEGPREGREVQLRSVTTLLNWDAERASDNERQLLAMDALLYGSLPDLGVDNLQTALGNILTLHEAVSRAFGLDRAAALAHRRELCAQLGRRLLRLAHRYVREGDRAGAMRTLADACWLESIAGPFQWFCQIRRVARRRWRGLLERVAL